MRDKTLVNIRHSLCQKQNPVERPAETIDAISSLRPIFWQKAAKLFDNPQEQLSSALVWSSSALGQCRRIPQKRASIKGRGWRRIIHRGEDKGTSRGDNCRPRAVTRLLLHNTEWSHSNTPKSWLQLREQVEWSRFRSPNSVTHSPLHHDNAILATPAFHPFQRLLDSLGAILATRGNSRWARYGVEPAIPSCERPAALRGTVHSQRLVHRPGPEDAGSGWNQAHDRLPHAPTAEGKDLLLVLSLPPPSPIC